MNNNKIENFRESLTQVCHALEAVYSEAHANLLVDTKEGCYVIYLDFPDKDETGHTYKFSCRDITSLVKSNIEKNKGSEK